MVTESRCFKIEGDVEEAGMFSALSYNPESKGNLYQNYQYDHRLYLSSVATIIQKHYSIDSISMNLSGNMFDQLWGGGANTVNIGMSHGKVNAKGVIPTNEGQHTLINYSASRQQTISEKLSLFLSVSGQITQDVSTSAIHTIGMTEDFLDSAESFSLGGLSECGLSFRRSYWFSWKTGDCRFVIYWVMIYWPGFYDWGWVGKRDPTTIVLRNMSYPEQVLILPEYNFGIYLSRNLCQAFWGKPNPSPTGMDQDGSLEEDRFGLS